MADGDVEIGDVEEAQTAEDVVEVAAESTPAGASMSVEEALQEVLKHSMYVDGLARGFRETVKALDKRQAQLCVLAESLDDPHGPAMVKLIEALCTEHGVKLIRVPDHMKLGEWVGLYKLDKDGNPRKVVRCSCCAVRNFGEDSAAMAVLQEVGRAVDEIRKAYRRKALELHPDKVLHRGDEEISVEDATKRFAEIQHAYEVLSDDNERSWYDAHRHEILRSSSYAAHRAGEGGDDDGDELNPDDLSDEYSDGEGNGGGAFSSFFGRASQSSSSSKKRAPTGRGIQTSDLMPLFSTSCFSSFSDDDPESFFAVYSEFFRTVEEEESEVRRYRLWRERHKKRDDDSDEEDPAWADTTFAEKTSFGKGTDGFEYCRGLYDKFTNFTTCKEFRWCDKWRLSEAPDRRVRRAMEKENKKARDTARQEYVSTVRRLATQIRSMDPRYKVYLATQRARAAEQRAAAEAARKREKLERADRAKSYVAPDWARTEYDELEALSHDEAAKGSDEDDEGRFCVACDRSFASARAWRKHEGTKSHKKNMEDLTRIMREEDQEMGDLEHAELDEAKAKSDDDADEEDVFEDALEEVKVGTEALGLNDGTISNSDDVSEATGIVNGGDRTSRSKKKKRKAKNAALDTAVENSEASPSASASGGRNRKRGVGGAKLEKPVSRTGSPTNAADTPATLDGAPRVAQSEPDDVRRAARMAAFRAGMDDGDYDERDGFDGENITTSGVVERSGTLPSASASHVTDFSPVPSTGLPAGADDSDSSIHREKRGKKKGRIKKGTSQTLRPTVVLAASVAPVPPPSVSSEATSWRCNVCVAEFPTRNQLFTHVKKNGHAVAVPVPLAGGVGKMEDAGTGKKVAVVPSCRTLSDPPMTSNRITDYAPFISKRSAARKPSAVRALQPLLAIPGMISLGGGYPDTATFPFESVSMKLKTGETLEIGKEDMAKVLQYNSTAGLPNLVTWLRDLQIILHKPPLADIEWDICVTTGSQDGLSKAFEMLLEPGDPVLMETPAYSGVLSILRPMGVQFVECPADSDGLNPSDLRRILSTWPSSKGPRPRVLYTVPEGGNPTGLSTTWERKKEVYSVCSEFGVIILEDDPYYLLQFCDPPKPSYLSIDGEGRVLRFDSFSKVLSSGIRVGWCTGPKPLIERIVLHGQVKARQEWWCAATPTKLTAFAIVKASNLHPSNLSQQLVASYLAHLGHSAYLAHARTVRDHYSHKRDAFIRLAERHLGGANMAAEWVEPKAGMFVWLKLVGIKDSGKLVREKAVERKVLLLPGEEFIPNGGPTPYVRAAFSTASESQMDEALKRLEIKILLVENVSQTAVNLFKAAGYQVEHHVKALPPSDLINKLKNGGFHALGIRSKTNLTAEVLRHASKLLVVGCFCIGTNQVDLEYAATHGIAVFNSPFSNTRSVAEMVVGEMIALARQLGDRNREMAGGVWNKVSSPCYELRGKRLGIVGYGHIGSQLSVLAEAMGLQVFAYDVVQRVQLGAARTCTTLEELLKSADFVTLHVPETPETKNMIGAREISLMKKGSYLINASRGTVVDLKALSIALKEGHLAGAAVDVFPVEPAANGKGFETELIGCPNTILTPHIGGSTEEAQSAIGIEVATALTKYLNSASTAGSVNFPEVDLRPPHEGTQAVRVVNVHRNVPGVLKQINKILSEYQIDKQTCDSRGEVAYLVADITLDRETELGKISKAITEIRDLDVGISSVKLSGKTFEVDHIFGEHIEPAKIFSEAARDLVESILEGHNSAQLRYGETGSGKTYTMLGQTEESTKSNKPGIIPMS
ncbi:hypothetical protein HDU93_000480 [Gonapodya sp. JEL0774]|nr:hypothetical protein HDU93_000480 [Gonapodya sp. JEL0774]